MTTTLFIVPALQVAWLRRSRRRPKRAGLGAERADGEVETGAALAASSPQPGAPLASSPLAGPPLARALLPAALAAAAFCASSSARAAAAAPNSPGASASRQQGDAVAPEAASPAAAALDAASDEPVLAFADAFDKIRGRSLRVDTQAAQISIADARRLKALGAFTPGLSATLGNASASNFGPPQYPPAYDTRSAYLNSTFNIFHFGADYETLAAERAQLRRERAQLEAEGQGSEDDAAQALFGAIEKSMLRDIQARLVATKEEVDEVARQRFEKGLLAEEEVEKARIDAENARGGLDDADADLANARAALRALLGTGLVRVAWPWREAIAGDGGKGKSLADAGFDLGKRPDWRSAEWQLMADRRRARAAWRRLLPSLDFTASWGTGDLGDPGRRDWQLGFTLTAQLFDHASGIAEARERAGVELQSEYAKANVARKAAADIATYRQAHRIAVRSALARERNLASARGLLEQAERRFRQGRETVNDLAIDQNRYFASERSSVAGWNQAHLSQVRICHALGGRIGAIGKCDLP